MIAPTSPPGENASPSGERSLEIEALTTALQDLATSRDAALAATLARFFTTIAAEAARGPRFSNALARALSEVKVQAGTSTRPKRANRRNPGPFDPFVVYAEGQEAALRDRLAALDLEQLRDIVAEHGMDNDRLAMKWKDPERVIDRIVERVAARASKGSAFR